MEFIQAFMSQTIYECIIVLQYQFYSIGDDVSCFSFTLVTSYMMLYYRWIIVPTYLQCHISAFIVPLSQIWSLEVKEQGLRSLWALAGNHISGQRLIAERIGPALLIELIMTKSEILQSIGETFKSHYLFIRFGTFSTGIVFLQLIQFLTNCMTSGDKTLFYA